MQLTSIELLNALESLPYFNLLLKKGIVPINWLDYKIIYEFYSKKVSELESEGFGHQKAKRTANTITGEEFKISERTVYLIIQKMK